MSIFGLFHNDLVDVAVRSVVAVISLFLLARLMGKKQISQLNFFDYVVGISIGSIAASMSCDDTISYTHGLAAMAIWAAFPIIISFLSLKSLRARKLIEGKPSVLIQNGHIMERNLAKEKYNLHDLLEELRIQGVFNVADVEFAILETSGKVSTQLKSQKQPLTAEDLQIPTNYQGLSVNLIIDGKILSDMLEKVNLNEAWLYSELSKRNINSAERVLLASLDTEGKLYIDLKDGPNTKNLLE